ncbi:hypothetical protein SO802_024813 [Lithocarpus litseifolius]|uniref:C-JID domain-containing protein n=1 Tax=Lithocarpus litseifolius TaxID=425828 RepID=A0AAW2CDR1_9ROSI
MSLNQGLLCRKAVLDGSIIPSCLAEIEGNSISIGLPSNWYNSKWIGFALWASLPKGGYHVMALGDMPQNHCAFELLNIRIYVDVNNELDDSICLLYLSCDDWFAKVGNGACSQINVRFEAGKSKKKISGKCGVSLIYKQDENEFNQTNAQCLIKSFGEEVCIYKLTGVARRSGSPVVDFSFMNSKKVFVEPKKIKCFKENTKKVEMESCFERSGQSLCPNKRQYLIIRIYAALLSQQKRGFSLVYEQDKEELNQAIAQCSSSRVNTYEGWDGVHHGFDNSTSSCDDYSDIEPEESDLFSYNGNSFTRYSAPRTKNFGNVNGSILIWHWKGLSPNSHSKRSQNSFAPDSDPELDSLDIDESSGSGFGMGMRARDKAKGGGVKFRVWN